MSSNSSALESGEIIITSGDQLNVENAAVFLQHVREALQVSKSVTVEFEPEVEIDITGMQIICAACKSAAVNGKTFSYKNLQPQGLSDMIAACGAEHYAANCKQINDSTCIWFGVRP
ncbi:MAG: hypothetical protein A2X83_03275 [Desulfuromonadales bacterium GWD2_54_10]|nr:MAG: hypothetical protein A2X83_03275 [Desulfuromonadales bacterium GWD2_54_10]